MKVNIGTYSFGGIASYLGLGPSLQDKFHTIRALGFDGVELLPVDLDNSVEDIRRWAAEDQLEIVSVHAKPTREIVEKMAALGGKAVIWASTDFCNRQEALEVAEELEAMAEMAAPYGIRVGYHNHSKEFFVDEGLPLIEHLLGSTQKCMIQLDCGWAMNAGAYPPSFIRKWKNRILSIHVKENSKVNGPGARPASAHAQAAGESPFAHVSEMSLEERQKMLAAFQAHSASPEAQAPFKAQCRLGAPESNLNWQEIRNALNEQEQEAFWVVEREGFYAGHDECIADDCAWLKKNIR